MADDEARGAATIRKWEREEERKRAKAEASEENFAKTFANELKKENIKKALAREAKDAVDNPNRRTELHDTASEGTSRALDEGEVITGDEPRPWESY